MQHSLSEKEYFDYAFLGMGAANALIFIKFFEAGLLYNKRIIIIDLQSVETLNQDKTYCFWSDPEEINRLGLNDMYTASWHQVKINSKVTPLGKYAYYHIPSAALMSRFKEVLERQHYKYIEDRVSDVNKQSDMFRIQTQSNDEFVAHLVFDSRLPQWNSPKSHQAHLLQSFYGQVVTASVPVFDPKTFTMMDFSVPQMGFTQFLYVLPYSKHKALVELTRFGTSVITKEEGQQFLQSWMLEQESKLSLEKEEYGVIPMSTAEIVSSPLEGMGNYFRVGTAAGRVKPSTGYAFKRMCRDALHLVEIVQNKQRSVKDFPRKESERFAFYDRLLLKILETTPSMGKHIFTRLFERISPIKVFRFLEEKTTIIEEVPILMSLPKKPFLAAAFRDVFSRINLIKRLPFVFGLCLIFCHLKGLDLLGWCLLSLGFLAFGMPHGALDHMLGTKDFRSSFKPLFIAKYLLLMMAMWVVWLLSPAFGFTAFVAYSAWHFGESDFQEIGLPSSIVSWFWGLFLLGSILLTHVQEFNEFLPYFSLGKLPERLNLLNSISLNDLMLGLTVCLGLIVSSIPKFRGLTRVSILLIMGYFMPLLWAFALYFIGNHSINGWKHLKAGLKLSHQKMWLYSLPFSLGAYALLAAFIALAPTTDVTAYWTQFFVFISCVSFPHVREMSRFYLESKSLVGRI